MILNLIYGLLNYLIYFISMPFSTFFLVLLLSVSDYLEQLFDDTKLKINLNGIGTFFLYNTMYMILSEYVYILDVLKIFSSGWFGLMICMINLYILNNPIDTNKLNFMYIPILIHMHYIYLVGYILAYFNLSTILYFGLNLIT